MKYNKIQKTQPIRKGFTFIELQAVIGIFALLFALFFSSMEPSRDVARKMSCQNNLKQLALGLNNYENKFLTFPPALTIAGPKSIAGGCKESTERTGGFSWRVLLLPEIEQQNIYDTIDFNGTAGVMKCSGENGPPGAPWTDSVKIKIDSFLCPDETTDPKIDSSWHGSNYAAMVSAKQDYNYIATKQHKYKTTKSDIGVLHPQKPAKHRDIAKDGTSHTILLVEVDRSRKLIEQKKEGAGFHYRCGRWFNSQGCLADAIRTPNDFGTEKNPKVDESALDNPVAWGTFRSKKTNGWGRATSSVHQGGVHVVLVDGSVHFITNDVDIDLYKATCTRSGRETETLEF